MLSLIAIIYGAIVALVQPDLKKLVAYSSVSHMGFVTLGIFVFTEQGLQGAILQMINHGLITGALFLLVGVIYERTHDRTIAKMGGLAALTPVYAAIFGFFVFASAGLPGLCPGSSASSSSLVGTFAANPYAAAVAAFVMILAAGYLLWMFQRVVFGEVSDFLGGLGHHLTDMTPVEILTLAPLGALVVIFGLFRARVPRHVAGTVRNVSMTSATGGADRDPARLAAVAIALPVAYVVLTRDDLRPSAGRGAVGARTRKAGPPVELAGLRHNRPPGGGHPDGRRHPGRRSDPTRTVRRRGRHGTDRPRHHRGPDDSVIVGLTPGNSARSAAPTRSMR